MLSHFLSSLVVPILNIWVYNIILGPGLYTLLDDSFPLRFATDIAKSVSAHKFLASRGVSACTST